MRKNICCDTDFYKLCHWRAIHPGLSHLYSYGESRVGSKYPFVNFFGLDMIIADHFLQRVTNEMIDEAEEETIMGGGYKEYFNREVWERVRDLGYLPIEIKAVPEGSTVPIDNVLFTITDTAPWFAKTLNTLESSLMHVWYPTTISTRCKYIKESIRPAFEKSSDVSEIVLPIAVNDFGYRGTTGHEAAARGGAAHLLHFIGGDNMAANRALKDYYGMKGRLKSVWATEHSNALSFGPGRGEIDYLLHQLNNAPNDAIISIVIDTYDANNFLQNVVGHEEVKPLIINRIGRTVFRPDRGIPLVNMCRSSDILGSILGFNMNTKGYKVIAYNTGLIQGDGMTEQSIPETYNEYIKTGWAADNFICGSGGGLLQIDANRDTQRFAIKPSYGIKDGESFNMNKSGVGGEFKKSKAGQLKLHKMGYDSYMTISSADVIPESFSGYVDNLQTVFKNGVHTPNKFEDILERVNKKNK